MDPITIAVLSFFGVCAGVEQVSDWINDYKDYKAEKKRKKFEEKKKRDAIKKKLAEKGIYRPRIVSPIESK